MLSFSKGLWEPCRHGEHICPSYCHCFFLLLPPLLLLHTYFCLPSITIFRQEEAQICSDNDTSMAAYKHLRTITLFIKPGLWNSTHDNLELEMEFESCWKTISIKQVCRFSGTRELHVYSSATNLFEPWNRAQINQKGTQRAQTSARAKCHISLR